jgi:hypothetical protein
MLHCTTKATGLELQATPSTSVKVTGGKHLNFFELGNDVVEGKGPERVCYASALIDDCVPLHSAQQVPVLQGQHPLTSGSATEVVRYNDAVQHILAASLKHPVFYPGWGLPRGFFCSVTPP